MRPNKSPVTNLFGGSLGFTLNKRQSIEREKSGHTPVRKKHGHTACRASSVRARVTIQETLSAEMSSLHVDDSLSRRVKLLDNCRTMIVTPDGDEDDEQRINDSADDSDYDNAPVANPTPKSLPRNIRNKKIGIFLGNPFDKNNRGRVLEQGFMMSLHGRITTKLDRKRLDRETTFIQHKDSAGILLNGVNHIYGRISVSREREQTNNNNNVPEGINDVIDEVMEYKPEILVPNIDDHVFTNEDGVDDDGMDDKEQEMTMEIGRLMTRPCLMDLVLVGWNKLKEMNVKKIRMVADERVQRKRTTAKYIMDRVKSMKPDL
jgi:hypothetical protein